MKNVRANVAVTHKYIFNLLALGPTAFKLYFDNLVKLKVQNLEFKVHFKPVNSYGSFFPKSHLA